MVWHSSTIEETQSLAKEVLAMINGRNIICLFGDLGAGKTTFVQGVGALLGVKNIASPTYILIRKHNITANFGTSSFKALVHVDLYRLETRKEILELGLIDICKDPENLVIIEWPEKILDLLPSSHLDLYIKSDLSNGREFTVKE